VTKQLPKHDSKGRLRSIKPTGNAKSVISFQGPKTTCAHIQAKDAILQFGHSFGHKFDDVAISSSVHCAVSFMVRVTARGLLGDNSDSNSSQPGQRMILTSLI